MKVLKCKNVILMVDKCILEDTKVFECFSMHLDVFTTYFMVLVVNFNATQCI
jgi:predicted thioesterase